MKFGRVFGLCLVLTAVLLFVGSLTGKVGALSIKVADSSADSRQYPRPEPDNLLLLGSALVGIGCLGLKRKNS